MARRTYEIIVYDTKLDFEKRNGKCVDEGITRKREAVKEAKKHYAKPNTYGVKVQSNDREFIQIFENGEEHPYLLHVVTE